MSQNNSNDSNSRQDNVSIPSSTWKFSWVRNSNIFWIQDHDQYDQDHHDQCQQDQDQQDWDQQDQKDQDKKYQDQDQQDQEQQKDQNYQDFVHLSFVLIASTYFLLIMLYMTFKLCCFHAIFSVLSVGRKNSWLILNVFS